MRALLLVVMLGCAASPAPPPASPPPPSAPPPPPPPETVAVAADPCDGGEADPCDGGEVVAVGELGGLGKGGGGVGVGDLGTVGHGGGIGSGQGYGAGAGGSGGGKGPPAPPVVRGGGELDATGDIDKTLVKKIIHRHLNMIRYCYERALRDDPSLRGKLTVQFAIDEAGTVVSATATGLSEELGGCVANAFRRMKFPARKWKGLVKITYPLVFQPDAS